MKTTRRSLLTMLGLGAAADAPVPAASVQAANSIQPTSRIRIPGDTDLARCCVTCGWTTPWSNAETTTEGLFVEAGQIAVHNVEAHDGVTQEIYGVWRPHDWQAETHDESQPSFYGAQPVPVREAMKPTLTVTNMRGARFSNITITPTGLVPTDPSLPMRVDGGRHEV